MEPLLANFFKEANVPITEQQRLERRKNIGSSDAAAILDMDPYRSGYDVWAEKTGRVSGERGTSEAAEIGNMLEEPLLHWCANELGVEILINQHRVCPDAPVLAANHDALVVGQPWGLEAKTSGLVNPFHARENWGDGGTDEVPDHILVQCHFQMIVSGLEKVYVPALLGTRGRVLYCVEADKALHGKIKAQLLDWWAEHVVKDIAPTNCTPSLETAKAIKREPKSVTTIPLDVVEAWRAAAEALKDAKAMEEGTRQALLAALGDAEMGTSPAGDVTYYQQTRKSFTVAEATFPVLRYKPLKGGK